MAANDWIDGDPTMQAADKPLHSGVTVDLLEGNLGRVLEQSRYDVQTYHNENEVFEHAFTGTTWQSIDDLDSYLHGWPIVVRRNADGSLRGVKVSIEGKNNTANRTTTVRIYLLPTIYLLGDTDLDSTYALGEGYTDYGELEFTSTSYSVETTTITPSDAATSRLFDVIGNDVGVTLPRIRPDIGVLHMVASLDTASNTVTMRAPRIQEVVTWP